MIQAVFTHGDRSGEQFKTITVRTNEAGNMPTRLSFNVLIPKLVEMVPVALFWDKDGKSDSREILVSFPEAGAKLLSVGISSHSNHLSAKLRCLEDMKKYVLTVTPLSVKEHWKEEIIIEVQWKSLGARHYSCYAYVK